MKCGCGLLFGQFFAVTPAGQNGSGAVAKFGPSTLTAITARATATAASTATAAATTTTATATATATAAAAAAAATGGGFVFGNRR